MKTKTFNYETVWAAACAAYRVNGAYIKKGDNSVSASNFRLMCDLLDNNHEIINEDIDMGNKIREYYQNKVIDLLAHQNPFLHNLVTLAQQEQFSGHEHYQKLGIICYSPEAYRKALVDDEISQLTLYSEHQGKIGDRIQQTFKIMKKNPSDIHRCYFFTAISGNSRYFFGSSNASVQSIDPGSDVILKGTIKAHIMDGVTQLNRVKLVKTL